MVKEKHPLQDVINILKELNAGAKIEVKLDAKYRYDKNKNRKENKTGGLLRPYTNFNDRQYHGKNSISARIYRVFRNDGR